MFPFKNKGSENKQTNDLRQNLINKRNERIDLLSNKFPLGSKFSYLGVACMVTHTSEFFIDYVYVDFIGAMPVQARKPELKADYVNKNGEIKCLILSFDEAMRLDT